MYASYDKLKLRGLYQTHDSLDIYNKQAVDPTHVGHGTTSAKFRVVVTGYAMYGDDCIAANLVGTRTSLYAVIGAFHSNRVTHALTVNIENSYKTVRLSTKTDQYKVYQQALASWNATNALILSTRLTSSEGQSNSTFVMANNIVQLIDNVYARLQSLLPIPTQAWWKIYLFRKGRDSQFITKLRGDGFNIYRIDMDADKWISIISEGLENNELAWTIGEHESLMKELNS